MAKDLPQSEIAAIEAAITDIEDRYARLCEAVATRSQELDMSLVASQGVNEGIDSLMNWLNGIDNNMR